MKASIVDLRYKTAEILKALDRNESVTVLYHGKVKGVIKPSGGKARIKITDHPFFGMLENNSATVIEELETLRQTRHAL